MNWAIIGHKQQLERLGNSIQTGNPAHGYLFAGPNGVGKKAVARQFARMLLGESGEFDYIEIASEGEIKIAQVRELVYKLSLKPYSAPYKVAVIDEAHEMNSEAANALLKSLEEPKSHTVIILVSSNPARLPKTIVSRVQKMTFGMLSQEELDQLPVVNSDLLAKVTDAGEYYQKISKSNLSEKLVLAQELSDWETADLKVLLETWTMQMQKELRANPSVKFLPKISAVTGAARMLDQNINSKLLLANLMLNI